MIDISNTIGERTEAAIRGNARAMGIVFQWYRPRLYAYALQLCGNTPLAQDAVQETFISAFTHIATLRNSSVFYPWLRKILANNCFLLLRKERSLLNQMNTIHSDMFIQESIEQNFEKTANRQLMHDALHRLSDELRSCILLRYFSNFNGYEDIALILNIPVGTVRSRLSAARQQLNLLCTRLEDANDEVFSQSLKWSEYYGHLWGNVYDDQQVRNEFFDHLQPSLNLHFTSGKTAKGRVILEKEVNEDLVCGISFKVGNISSCGGISVIEGINLNSIEHPDRCTPSTVFVLFREKNKVNSLHIFDSPR